MRRIFLAAALMLASTGAGAQTQTSKDAPKETPRDMKALFDAVQKLGTDSELRGDIAERLGFGEDSLLIKDFVIKANGVQHALNAFVAGDKSYLLFDSHLYAPEVYIFVEDMDGALVSGIHGRQYQPITGTVKMVPTDGVLVVSEEEAFWRKWLADGAKPPPPVN